MNNLLLGFLFFLFSNVLFSQTGWNGRVIKQNDKDQAVLLEKLNLCVVEKNNSSTEKPWCFDDDYSIFYLDNYLVVFVEGKKNYDDWCGENGCAILVFKHDERRNIYKEIYYKTGLLKRVYPEAILYTERDGSEEELVEIIVENNKIRFIYTD